MSREVPRAPEPTIPPAEPEWTADNERQFRRAVQESLDDMRRFFTPNGAPSIQIGSSKGGGPLLAVAGDVRLSGAFADGSDVATEINNQFTLSSNHGVKVVLLPAGDYGIGSAITPFADFTVRGSGKDRTTIKALADAMTMVDLDGVSGVQIEGITLDGDRANRSDVTGIDWGTNQSRCEFRDVRFLDIPGTALLIDECFDSRFFGINVEDCGDTGDPCIDIKATANTSNMLFFYGLQVQNGHETQLKIDANTFGCGFWGAHLEWFSGDADAQTHEAVDCAGYRNLFERFHVAQADQGFLVTGPRNELHACMTVESGTRGLYISGTSADGCKVIGGAYDGWRVDASDKVELHGVGTSTTANCLFNSPQGKIVGGDIEGISGDEALTIESGADDAIVDDMTITGWSGEVPVFVGAASRVTITSCNIKGIGTIARYIDATASFDSLFHGNMLNGTTPTVEDIGPGTGGTTADNKSV